MNISPIYCPDSGCFWSAHGIPDQYTEARDWHLAAHRAEEHDEPLTEEQIVYATRAGHVIPGTARTTAAAVAALGALPVPVGDEPQPLDETRLAEITARVEAAHPGPWRRSDDDGSLERYVISEDGLFAISFGYRGNTTQAEADFVAHAREDVPALLAEIQRLKAERHSTNEALDDAVQALREMRDRLAKYEQPTAATERNAVRQSFTELIAQAQEDRDYEGAFSLECQLRDREEQWKRESAATSTTNPSKEA